MALEVTVESDIPNYKRIARSNASLKDKLVECSRVELPTRLCGLLLAIYTVTPHIWRKARESNSNRTRDPAVFETAASPADITFHK